MHDSFARVRIWWGYRKQVYYTDIYKKISSCYTQNYNKRLRGINM